MALFRVIPSFLFVISTAFAAQVPNNVPAGICEARLNPADLAAEVQVVERVFELLMAPRTELRRAVAGLETRTLVETARQIVILNSRFAAAGERSYKLPTKGLVFPRYILHAYSKDISEPLSMEFGLQPDESDIRVYNALSKDHILKRFSRYIAKFREGPKFKSYALSVPLKHELLFLLNAIARELTNRPSAERLAVQSDFAPVPEDILLRSTTREGGGGGFFIFQGPPLIFDNWFLNIYLDALYGFWGTNLHHAINQKYGRDGIPGEQIYTYVGYEEVSSSYADIEYLLRSLRPALGSTFVDIGSGYGRVALAMHRLRPDLQFTGYEIVPERFEASVKIAQENNLAARFRLDNVNRGVEAADYYYFYEPTSKESLQQLLKNLQRINERRKGGIRIIAKSATRTLLPALHEASWLEPETWITADDNVLYRVYAGLKPGTKKSAKWLRTVFSRKFIQATPIKDLRAIVAHALPEVPPQLVTDDVRKTLATRLALEIRLERDESMEIRGIFDRFFRKFPIKEHSYMAEFYFIWKTYLYPESDRDEFVHFARGPLPKTFYEDRIFAIRNSRWLHHAGGDIERLLRLPPSKDPEVLAAVQALVDEPGIHARLNNWFFNYELQDVLKLCRKWKIDCSALSARVHE